MADVLQGRFSQYLRRVFQTKIVDPGSQLSPIIAPSAEVNDAYQPESRASRGERLLAMGDDFTFNIANPPNCLITNPAGSGKLFVLRRVAFSGTMTTAANQTGRGGGYIAAPVSTIAGANVGLVSKDMRLGQLAAGYNNSTTQWVSTSAGTYVGSWGTKLRSAIWGVEFSPGAALAPFFVQSPDLDCVLFPGATLQVNGFFTVAPTAQWTISVQLDGYERTYETNELNPPGGS